MPPRTSSSSLTGTFALGSSLDNEVVCPLTNQDGSHCRKRCLGEKRYRSMQEHIRRAHPEYYIPKLPATKESFELMITSPPHERPAQDPNHANQNRGHAHALQQHALQHSDPSGLSPAFGLDHAGLNSSFEGYHSFGQHDGGYYTHSDAEAAVIYQNMQAQQRSSDEYRRGSLIPAASAAAALAQLHYHRPDSDWGGDNMGQVILPSLQMSPTNTEADFLQSFYADQGVNDLKTNSFNVDPALEDGTFMHDHYDHSGLPVSSSSDAPGLLPSSLARSPPDRSTTLPPMQRSLSRQFNRPRKTSLSQQARMAKHERKRSKDLKRHSGERKALSAEPSALMGLGKRWEDLIDAAQSATEEEDSRDLTPIPASPYQSPQVHSRTSLPPPFALGSQFQSIQASPLNRALTPPPPDGGLEMQPFPSVESSIASSISHHHANSAGSTGSQFHIMNPNSLTSPSESSPLFNPAHPAASSSANTVTPGPVQIYCAGCRRLSTLKDSYACTNCICGLCGECVTAIINGQSRGRMSMCPQCHAMDSSFKPFQLDVR